MKNLIHKIEKKINLQNLVKKIFIVFMILQPILDIYMSLFDEKVQIMGVSLATILRFMLTLIMLVLVMIYSRKRKCTKFFLMYSILAIIYAIFHHLNSIKFSVELPEAKYSALNELLYLARMCIPPALIYIIYNIKLNYKDIKKIVISVSLMISLVIIIANFTKIGFMAYAVEKDVISDNMLSWFSEAKEQYHWSNLTCRGLFQSANQLSGVTVILVPILTYICLKENKLKNWLVLFLHLIAMINLTTRVAACGGIALFILTVFIYMLEKIIHKNITVKFFKTKNLYCFILVTIFVGIIFINSPFISRLKEGNLSYDMTTNTQTSDNTNTEDITLTEDIDKIKYIEENIESSNINGYFIYQAYPYTEDADFWFNLIMNVPEYERAGNRKMRSILIERILERDNRMSNYIWGISFTRSSSFVWPERDFETQLDALGIVGVSLFILPYLVVFTMGILNFFRKFKDNLYLGKCVYMISLAAGILAAYSSGHILNEVFPFTFLSMVTGIVLNTCFNYNPECYSKKNILKKYFEKIYKNDKITFYNEIKENLKNEEKKFIITANPETLMTSEKNLQLQNCLLKNDVTIIPDGFGLLKGLKLLGYPQKEVIPGVELVEKLFNYCNEMEKTIFLFGAKKQVLSALEKSIREKYPNARVIGKENGYVQNKQEVFEQIKKLSPDVILVALGIPEQEILINNNFENFSKGIFVGVGGSFDVLSGIKKRAPKIFITLHLEWFYRIITEPQRLKRFLQNNVKYLFKLYEEEV